MAKPPRSEYPAYLKTPRLDLVLQNPNRTATSDREDGLESLPKNDFLDLHLALVNHPKSVEAMGDMQIRRRETYDYICANTTLPHFHYPGEEDEASYAGIWNVYLSSDKALGPIGGITIASRRTSGVDGVKNFPPDMGWATFPDHYRKGYASEAAGAVLNYLFEHTHLTVITAFPIPTNSASRAVAEKIGMEDWGVIPTDEGDSVLYAAVKKGEEEEARRMKQSWGKGLVVHIMPEGFKPDV